MRFIFLMCWCSPLWLNAAEPTQLEIIGVYSFNGYAIQSMVPAFSEKDETYHGFSSFHISCGDQVLFAQTGDHRYSIGPDINKEHSQQWLQVGARLLGPDKDPCVIIQGWSGGAHCGYTLHIYSLGRFPRHIDSLPMKHGSWEIKDLNNDQVPEICARDWTYAYHWTCFTASPAPRIVLKLNEQGSAYVIAPEFMLTAAPEEQELHARVEKTKAIKGEDDDYLFQLYGTMLELCYSGHAELAWSYLEKCWPADKPGKLEFIEEFKQTMNQSPYWQALQLAISKNNKLIQDISKP